MSNSKNIEVGKNVIKIEAQAVAAIANRIGNEFDNAVNTILNCKGRLIILGMGKSGLISQKIASTMASTGTPSHFVHPADAFHGDLGMITKEDVVLMVSNSGETHELLEIIPSLKRKAVPTISMVGKENSTLFDQVENEFGVPREIITSILGVETRYGKIKGSYRVLDSLTTLGFDFPRRSKFFKSELIQFFILTRENNLDINSVQGSYAGAMGYGQFISSSYRAYAIDYDDDGYADLFNSIPDAVASIANYLKKHGWKRDGVIVTQVELNKVNKTYKHPSNLNKFIPLQFTEGLEGTYFIQEGDSLLSIAINNLSLIHISEPTRPY